MEDFSELYYQTPCVRAFDAQVVACEAYKDGAFAVELSQTAFYPEGGGQPGDRGTLANLAKPDDPAVKVTDTRKLGDRTVCICCAALPLGARVHGVLDWCWRRDNMEAHTGEHIVSGLVHKAFGYDNIGFHMGTECIEVDFSGPIEPEQILEIEQRANEAVRADLPVRELLPGPGELAGMDYRSKKELAGQVRLVEIPGVDLCACCGTHVETTGQVGLIKVLGITSKKGGTRVEMLCGRRALLAYEDEMAQFRRIGTLLSAKPGEVADAAQRLWDEKLELKRQLAEAVRARLSLEIAALPEGRDLAVLVEPGLSIEDLRYVCNTALETGRAATCAALSPAGEAPADSATAAKYNYVLASSSRDLRDVAKPLNERLGGRGGGRPEMVQGSYQANEDDIRAALAEILA